MDGHAAVAAPAEFKVAFALHLGADLPHRLEPARRRRAGHLRGVMFVVSASGQRVTPSLPSSSSAAFSHNIAWRDRLRWRVDVAECGARHAITRASVSDRIAALSRPPLGEGTQVFDFAR